LQQEQDADGGMRLDRKLGNQQNGRMKTTLDLPDALVREIKIRAVRRRQKLKDAMAELLRRGLSAAGEPAAEEPEIVTDNKTGLPVIVCHRAAPAEEMTPERVADALLGQETEWHHAAGR
jgi:hypothetical protein